MNAASRQVWQRALLGGVNLAVAGSSAVASAALGSWSVLALGAAAYAALVAWDASSQGDAGAVVDPARLRDPALAAAARALLAARAERARVLGEADRETEARLSPALASAARLEARAADLLARAEALSAYLARSPLGELRGHLARLEAQRDQARGQARGDYEEARKARAEQLEALDDIARTRELIAANVARIVATVEAIPAKIVRLGALDQGARDRLSGSMRDELACLDGELAAFDEALKVLEHTEES